MIATAVHRTDCFAYDSASALTAAVATYHGELSGLFSAAMPEVFPARVRSRARGEALGTRMQAEMHAGRFDVARRLNEEALEELAAEDDKARQRPYRCQLETLAGDLARARTELAASLGVNPMHASIGAAITSLPAASGAQGFALLHWLRLGRAALLSSSIEHDDFLAAWTATKWSCSPWLTGEMTEYPAHGILRHAAMIHALSGAPKDALGCITVMRKARSTLVLSTILLATLVEVAGLLWVRHRPDARGLVEEQDRDRPGALEVLRTLGAASRAAVPELWQVFAPWEGSLRGALKGAAVRPAREILLELGRVVPS